MMDLTVDVLRVSHMLAFAIGIGGAAFLELQVVRRFRNRIDHEGLRVLLFGHDLIRRALYALWATGLALLILRLGFLGGAFSAKLAAKLVVVTLLTLNMRLIERVLIPEIFEWEGARVADIPARTLAEFGAIAGFSAGCWCSALLLGGIGRMKTMDAWEIASVLVPLIAAAAISGAAMAMIAGWQGFTRRPRIVPGE